MIRVALFNWKNDSFRVDFTRIPAQDVGDYQCRPEGILCLECIQQISQELLEGHVSGWVEGYRWYRQVMAMGEAAELPPNSTA
jgi:hypothetical protein